jgi:CHAT domain-containing protein
LGSTYGRLGDEKKALEYHEQSLAIRRTLKAPAALAASLDATGRSLNRLQQRDKAIEVLSEALRISRDTGDPTRESGTLKNLALVERERGNLETALAHITASVDLTDSLRTRVISPDLRASFVASSQEQYELHIDILMRLHREQPNAGFDRRALEASERGRARVLLESLLEARTDVRQGVDPELLEQERNAQRQIDTASATLSRLLTRRSELKEIAAARARLEQLNTDARALRVRIRQQSPAYAALTQPPSITVREIAHDLLDSNTILIEYALGDRGSWVWAVTRSGLTSVELPARQEIERGARAFYLAVTARHARDGESADVRQVRIAKADAEARTKARALGRMLFGPIAIQLGDAWRGKRLLIVAPDALQYVPFASLIDPADGKQPMVIGHEIVSLPSAAVLAAIRRDSGRAAARGDLAVFADPVFDAGDPRIANHAPPTPDQPPAALTRAITSIEAMGTPLPSRLSRLPFSRDEARAITALVPADRRLQAIDFEASRATAMRADLATYRIVHFATHGFLNTEQPELSGLVLSLVDRHGRAQDGFLRMNDIYNLRLPADLVVLSACQTALGKAIRGEGLVGLTRGFMYAGARRVVASLWQVDDLATAELMRIFYRRMLKDRLSPSAALRAAQQELSRDPRWASPYYWSAFVLQGEWH